MVNATGTPFWDELPVDEATAWEEEFEERAAIMEHHGGMKTSAAEVEAYQLLEGRYRAEKELLRLGKLQEGRAGMLAADRPRGKNQVESDEESAGDS